MSELIRWRLDRVGMAAAVRYRAREWLDSAALDAVLRDFGGADLERTPRELARWSSGVLDTRGGRERQVVEPVDWSQEQARVLLASAEALGLTQTAPATEPAYDHTIVMAGTTTANRLRVALVESASRAGVDLGAVIGLASSRPLPDWERARHADVVHIREWADLAMVLTKTFGGHAPTAARDDALDLKLSASPARELRLLSAPDAAPGRRADSAQALDYLAAQLKRPLGRVLIVTSSIYAPYTFFVAFGRLAPMGPSAIEVVGTPTDTTNANAALAQRFAQEINSTLQAIARYAADA